MNKNKKRLIWGVVFMALCFVMLLYSGLGINKLEAMTPNCACIYNPDGIGMTIGDMYGVKSLSHMSALYVLAMSKTEPGMVSAEFRTPQEVNITYATPMDEDIVPMEFTGGGWFSDWSGQEENLAVIPQSLAIEFFATDVPNGAGITVNGKLYEVCGVYKDTGGLASDVTGNDLSRVYLSDDSMEDMEIAELYISDKQGRDVSYLQQWLNGVAMVRIVGDTVDYRLQLKLVYSLYGLELLICTLFFAALLFVTGGTFITSAHSDIGKKPWRVFVGIGIIAVTLLGAKLVLDGLYIPSAYLPQENIFDFQFYYDRFTGWLRWINEKGVYGSFDRIFAYKAICLLAAGGFGVVLFCIGIFKVFIALKTRIYLIFNKTGKESVVTLKSSEG